MTEKESQVNHKLLGKDGKEAGSIKLEARVFAGKISPDLVHQTVRWQLNSRRAGTHSTLTRAEVSGGGRKPHAQKGTGRARAGSNTSPVWVGGGKAHGPKPRDYSFRLPKRTRRQALVSVLSDKFEQGKVVILEDLQLKQGRTKEFLKILSGLKLEDRSVLLLVPDAEKGAKKGSPDLVSQAARNIENILILPVQGINVYDLLNNDVLLSTKAGIEALQSRVLGENRAGKKE